MATIQPTSESRLGRAHLTRRVYDLPSTAATVTDAHILQQFVSGTIIHTIRLEIENSVSTDLSLLNALTAADNEIGNVFRVTGILLQHQAVNQNIPFLNDDSAAELHLSITNNDGVTATGAMRLEVVTER